MVRRRPRKVANVLDFVFQRNNATMVNVMIQTLCSKNAFVRFDDDAMILELFKDELKMLQVLLTGGTSNEEINYVSI